jgi:hypothetical protein
MKYKISWTIVIIFSLIISLFCDYKFIKTLNNYYRLKDISIAKIQNSYIKKIKNNKYIVFFEYSLNVKDKVFFNKNSYDKTFLNAFTAKEFKDKILKSIERNFPVKSLLYSAISTIVFLYFIFLKYYLLKFYKTN